MNPAAQLMALIAAMLIPLLIIGIFMIICMWMIYSKAGKPGWACIIPIYSFIVLLEIVGKPWWWLFLLIIPIVNIVILIIVLNQLSKSFGQGAGFTLGLLFVGIVFYPILAFSKSIKYVGPGGVAAAPAQA
jgi:hypothetical protein